MGVLHCCHDAHINDHYSNDQTSDSQLFQKKFEWRAIEGGMARFQNSQIVFLRREQLTNCLGRTFSTSALGNES